MHRSMRRVLGIRRTLVHVTAAALIDYDPGHDDVGLMLASRIPVGQSLDPQREREVRVGMPERIATVEMPHVPHISAERLGHPDSITSVAARRCGQYRFALPVVYLHLRTGLEPAASEDNGATGPDAPLAVAVADDQPAHFIIGTADKAYDR